MDFGIAGRWALVCAASKGLGKGCAQALAREGVNLVITARGDEALQATASELRAMAPGIEVRTVTGDITAPEVMLMMRPKPRSAMPSTVALISSMGVSMLASSALIQASRSH